MKQLVTVVAALSLALAAALTLPGCKTLRDVRFERDAKFCSSIGATGDTYSQCMMQRDAQHEQAMANANASTAQFLAAQQQNRTRVTNCVNLGTVINCTSN